MIRSSIHHALCCKTTKRASIHKTRPLGNQFVTPKEHASTVQPKGTARQHSAQLPSHLTQLWLTSSSTQYSWPWDWYTPGGTRCAGPQQLGW